MRDHLRQPESEMELEAPFAVTEVDASDLLELLQSSAHGLPIHTLPTHEEHNVGPSDRPGGITVRPRSPHELEVAPLLQSGGSSGRDRAGVTD